MGAAMAILAGVLAYILLITGLSMHKGFYDPASLILVALSFFAFLAAIFSRNSTGKGFHLSPSAVCVLMWLLVACEIGIGLKWMRGVLERLHWRPALPLMAVCIALSMGLAASRWFNRKGKTGIPPARSYIAVGILYCTAIILRIAVLAAPEPPKIDVYYALNDGAASLWQGKIHIRPCWARRITIRRGIRTFPRRFS
jgi:hypothetical protein